MTSLDDAAERACYELAAKINDGAPVYLTLLKCWKSATEAAAKKCEDLPIDEASLFADRKWTTAALVRKLCAAAIRGG